MPLLVVSAFLDYLMLCIGFLSAGSFAFLSFKLFVKPVLEHQSLSTQPPEPGHTITVLFNLEARERLRTFNIGQLYGDLCLRLKGVKEEHLAIEWQRDAKLEEYELKFRSNGFTLWQMPHSKGFDRLKKEEIASSTLIGSEALFRLIAIHRHGDPQCYIDIKLISDFIINKKGIEQMQFQIQVMGIFSGQGAKSGDKYSVDLASRNRRGIYDFKMF